MNRGDLKYLVLRTAGNFLLLFAIFGVIATFGPALYYEAKFQLIKARGVDFKIASVDTSKALSGKTQTTFGDLLTGSKQQEITPIDTEFSIVIPKIGAAARIFPNIDPSDENAFLPILKEGVAHARGSVFPGGRGNIFLFAHSTDNFWDAGRYNAVFYLLNKLVVGDDVIVFYENKRHNYKVTETKIVESDDTHYIASNLGQGERVILQTCWPPGTAWKRLLVFAEPL